MKQIRDYSDPRERGWCIHCGKDLNDALSNADHVPTKALLREPKPDNLPTVEVCKSCNSGFQKDEDYTVAFLAAVCTGTTEVKPALFPGAHKILTYPGNEKLRNRIAAAKTDDDPPEWRPEVERIKRVMLKNARGHWLFEMGKAVSESPSSIWVQPFAAMSEEQIRLFDTGRGLDDAVNLWPEVGSRMLQRMAKDGWVEVQEGVYRYSCISSTQKARVRMVLYEYLAAQVEWDRM